MSFEMSFNQIFSSNNKTSFHVNKTAHSNPLISSHQTKYVNVSKPNINTNLWNWLKVVIKGLGFAVCGMLSQVQDSNNCA